MQLSFDQIKAISFGALFLTEEEDGVHYQRCTDKQIAAWGEMHPDLGERAGYSSGIVLDFHTNSKVMRFAVSNGTSYDIFINGVLRATLNMKEQRKKNEPATIELDDPLGDPLDECRVTVYFPRGNDPAVIKYIELDDGAAVMPHKYDSKMVFYGDSITQGCSSVVHSFCYAHLVAEFFNAESLNLGVGGGRFDPRTVDQIDYAPDTVVVSFGTNDYNHYQTLDDMKQNATAFLSAVKALHQNTAKHFFVISPIWRADLKQNPKPIGSFAEARQIVIDAAKDHGMIHIDGLSLVPPFPEYFRDEYLHPNDLGFCLYAQNVIKAMSKYLK